MTTPRSPVASGCSFDISVVASRSMLKEPIRLTRMILSKSASGIGPSRPTTRLAAPMPAQFTSTRAAPCALDAAATAASAEAPSATSQATATPPISAATVSASFALRSHTATFTPALASRRAVAAPNPDAPPVTIAAWSFSCMVSSLIDLARHHLLRQPGRQLRQRNEYNETNDIRHDKGKYALEDRGEGLLLDNALDDENV